MQMTPLSMSASAFLVTGKVSGPNTTSYSKRACLTFPAGTGNNRKGVVGLVKGSRKAKSAYPLVVAKDHRAPPTPPPPPPMVPPGVPTSAFLATGKVSGSKRAYVTFLAGTGDNWKGVVGLVKGLRKAKSAYPLVVAMSPDVPEVHREILRSQGCIIEEIEPVYPPENQIQFAMAYYVINYSKLRIWNMEEYSKMVYLDADIQVFDNIDHLFDMPGGYLYGVMDCFCEKTWSHSPQFSVGYCQQCPDKVKWPVESMGSPPPLYFNAGMFVFEPSHLTYQTLLDALRITPPTPFAEQDFLNMFFEKKYKPIPLLYNLVVAMLWRHPEKVELEKVKVVHYCAAGSKPWRYTGNEVNMDREDIKMLIAKWWDIYNDESLDFES